MTWTTMLCEGYKGPKHGTGDEENGEGSAMRQLGLTGQLKAGRGRGEKRC